MKRDDTLWKSILEDLFIHFMHFFFEDAEEWLDEEKKVEFLDKEMAQISGADKMESPKFVDKLVKVFTKEGEEKWVLIHIEVQGYKDPDFAERMYIYHLRIFDRYRRRIAAIVLLTDDIKGFHPTQYHSLFLGTEITFRFRTYKILDQDEEALNQSSNPFAFVILTALLALKKRKMKKSNDEEDLLQLKIALTRRLLDQKFSRQVITRLFHFINNYVVFEKDENNRKFESTIDSITEKNKTMGIVELLKERQIKALREEYIEKGKAVGKAEGKAEGKVEGKAEEKEAFIRNLYAANKFTVAEIANFAGVTEAFVRKIIKKLK